MATTVTKYKIFLASPSDVHEDRLSIDEVIHELNLSFGRQNDLVIELIKWETHSIPGVSLDHPQKLINEDLGNDYDLFIGILWKKFGTATDTANSGTEEEFLNAYERFQKNPDSLQILFYFKNAPVSMSELDPIELQKIQSFKSDIGKNKKVLYHEYNEISQLAQFLRIHIPSRLLQIKNQSNIGKTDIVIDEAAPVEEVYIPEVLEDEYGLIDYQEMMSEYLNETNQSLTIISDATNWISDQMAKKTEEINAMIATNSHHDFSTLKNFFIRTAKIMDNYANRISPEIPIFFDNFEKAIDCISEIIILQNADFTTSDEEIETTKESVEGLIYGIESATEGLTGMLISIKEMPRMSKEFNKAKSNVVLKLDDLLLKLKMSASIAKELQSTIDLY